MSYNANIKNSNAYAFPSSNSNTNGKPTSETNLRDILTRLHIQNFVVNESTGLTLSSGTLTIPAGYQANINGTLVTFNATQTITGVASDTNVYLYLNYDNSTPPLLYGPDAPDTTILKGVYVDYVDPSTDDEKKISLQIAKVVSGNLDNTFIPNVFPLSTNEIAFVNDSGDITTQTLSDYLNNTVANTYLSKVADDTKKGNVTFAATGSTNEIIIDNTKIEILENNVVSLKLSGNKLKSDGKIEITSALNGVDIQGATQVRISCGNAILTVQNNVVQIGSTSFIIDNTNIKIKPMGKVIIDSDLDVTGNINATGTIIGSKVYNAVYN